MPTEREIYEGAKALALQKFHPSKLTEDLIGHWKLMARAVLVAAEAVRRANEEALE